MAETTNISQMAERISNQIFAEFGWKKVGPTNINWNCEDQSHGKSTHPSDVVFYYDEPYRDVRTYVQTDLKSYSAGSITKTSVRLAIESLASQVSCADKSDQWRDLYVHDHRNYNIVGLLFIYNHDGGYDRAFYDVLETVELKKIGIAAGTIIYVVGPDVIYWLNNVSQDIVRLRGTEGEGKLPPRANCSFFYPQPVRRAYVRQGKDSSASVEILTGPWIIMQYSDSPSANEFLIYLRHNDTRVDDYLYLLDYVRQHEMLQDGNKIRIRLIDPSGKSLAFFQKAQQQYIDYIQAGDNTSLSNAIKRISHEAINNTQTTFSEIEIGMD